MLALEMAADAPATRRSLRRRRVSVAVVSVGAALMFLMAANSLLEEDRARDLQSTGVATTASVIAVESRPVGHGMPANGKITVRYPVDDTTHEQVIWVGTEIGRFHLDQAVDVLVDPHDSSRVVVAGLVTSRSLPVGPLVFLGLILVAMAIVAGRHVRLMSRVLRWDRWVELPSRVEQDDRARGTRRARILLTLETVDGEVTLEPIGLNRLDPGFAPTAWAAGLGSRHVVVANRGGAHVLLVAPVEGCRR